MTSFGNFTYERVFEMYKLMYLTEKQVGYLQSGRLREVVALIELTGYGYCHRNMQISRDFRTLKLLGSN